MSAPEPYVGGDAEPQRSSVKLVRNAKGETQVEVKVYVGDSDDDVEAARQRAVTAYNTLCAAYGR